jgi:hypothetical protein
VQTHTKVYVLLKGCDLMLWTLKKAILTWKMSTIVSIGQIFINKEDFGATRIILHATVNAMTQQTNQMWMVQLWKQIQANLEILNWMLLQQRQWSYSNTGSVLQSPFVNLTSTNRLNWTGPLRRTKKLLQQKHATNVVLGDEWECKKGLEITSNIVLEVGNRF